LTVSTRRSRQGRAALGRRAGDRLDQLHLDERPRRVVDQDHAVEARGHRLQAGLDGVLPPLAPGHDVAQLRHAAQHLTGGADPPGRHDGHDAVDGGRLGEGPGRAEEHGLAGDGQERLGLARAHALAASGRHQDGQGVHRPGAA